MSIDYGEVERQFLATLEQDTGRSLAAWMAAVEAQGLAHRNDIIDWLRRQGFMFSKASWLERIHNNGGQPIYQGMAGPRPRTPRPPRLQAARAPAASAEIEPPQQPKAAPQPATTASTQDDAAALDALIVRAKAFRPLAVYVIAEIRKAVPGVVVGARDGYATFSTGKGTFAVLAVSAKDLRLGIAGTASPGSPWEPGKLALRGAPATTHLVVLNDARQITPDLVSVLARTAAGL